MSLVLVLTLSLLLVLFFRPDVLINVRTLELVLEKTRILETWSWDKGNIEIKWNKWNNRNFKGSFRNLCLKYNSEVAEVSSCFEKISWNMDLGWNFKEGPNVKSIEPFTVRSDLVSIKTKDQKKTDIKAPPPDISGYWKMLWSDLVPDMDIIISEIRIHADKKPLSFNLSLQKLKSSLVVNSMGLKLEANPEKIEIFGPPSYKLPGEYKLKKDLELMNLKLVALMKEKGVPLTFTGELEGIMIDINSFIDLPLRGDFTSLLFRKAVALNTRGEILISDLKKVVSTYAPAPYDKLPAPLNAMNGSITVKLLTDKTKDKEFVLFKTSTGIDLSGKKQALQLSVHGDIPLNVMDFSRGLIQVGLDFEKVILQLPRLSKKSPPPQFFPDNRFKTSTEAKKTEAEVQSGPDIAFDIEALNERALHIKSNLLDEPLRLNLNLAIRKGEVKTGFVKVLPLKTSVFKRPVRIIDLTINFNHPLEPVIDSTIQFPLPEYKITLKLEGPLSDPRHAFTSDPPLPKNDIYAVLLFGRPMSDLGADDKSSARATNKLLAQGILSLSVLYFLSGSPVEYVGYDPDTGRANAQIGLDQKTSLKVGAGEGGGSTGVRRSLGKGWYLDTSVQQNNDPSNDDVRNYGVLLERIIAY
jgi:hypothetical protein